MLDVLRAAWRWFADSGDADYRPFDYLLDCAWCNGRLLPPAGMPLVTPQGALLPESVCGPACARAYYADRHAHSATLGQRRADAQRFYAGYLAERIEAVAAEDADRISDMTGGR